MKLNPFNTKIGLALGGGAAKGIAHIGVLKAFEEEKIEITCISGTSIGALVAAYHAFGKSSDEIMDMGKELSFSKVANFTLRKRGFFTTDSIRNMILRDLGDVNIEDSKVPLAIIATDISTGEKIVFKHGSLVQAVCASVAVPGAYVPIEHEGRLLVDGGITENVPVSVLPDMGAGIVIGIDLNGVHKYPDPQDFMGVLGNAFDIAIDLRTRDQLKKADIVVSLDLSDYSRLGNVENAHDLYMEGYMPMKNKIAKVLWYKRTNLFQYAIKVVKELIPLKVPQIIKDYKEKIPKIEI
ncbi:MAG: patatin [Halobacteriovoraceae bacterium]|nr:patatin [Halobacteriovoraceae bacterium]|tara:strand:+ start:112900 stop:113787 length:888 start_codon:yes stop_codon:yes gene_type:complete